MFGGKDMKYLRKFNESSSNEYYEGITVDEELRLIGKLYSKSISFEEKVFDLVFKEYNDKTLITDGGNMVLEVNRVLVNRDKSIYSIMVEGNNEYSYLTVLITLVEDEYFIVDISMTTFHSVHCGSFNCLFYNYITTSNM